MTKKSKANTAFKKFLKTTKPQTSTCTTCSTCSKEVLANIKLYAEMKAAGSTDVSWEAVTKHLKENYQYSPTKYSLMRHCSSCLNIKKNEGK